MSAERLISSEHLTPRGAVVVHEPYGFVHLQDYAASDTEVVNAARVSFNRSINRLDKEDVQVLRFLMRERHGTPFEHNYFRFHVRAPIFVMREWHRHRISSINEESGRYIEMQDDFYLPAPHDLRTQSGRPGQYTFAPIQDADQQEEILARYRQAYSEAYAHYQALLAQGLARELARAVLPSGLYSQMIWSVNARSLMNFLSLRNAPEAMQEIRDYAQAIEQLFAQVMPETHQAFVDFGRRSP